MRFLEQKNAFASIQVAVRGEMDAHALGNAFDAVWPDEDIDTFGLPALGLSPLTDDKFSLDALDRDNHEMSKMAMEIFDFECEWEIACDEQAKQAKAKPKDLARHRLKKDRAVALTSKARSARLASPPKPPKSPNRTSKWRGVTKHKITSRWEAHLWDSNYERKPSVDSSLARVKGHCGRAATSTTSTRRRGRQVYLGGWINEIDAARAYDLCVLRFFGTDSPALNFPREDYSDEIKRMQEYSCADWVSEIRRRSSGFSRGVSAFRGVTSHKGKNSKGKWESRIGRVLNDRYLYLGTFDSEKDAAMAYDCASIYFRGSKAVTNFPASNYTEEEITRAGLDAKML